MVYLGLFVTPHHAYISGRVFVCVQLCTFAYVFQVARYSGDVYVNLLFPTALQILPPSPLEPTSLFGVFPSARLSCLKFF